MSSIATSPAASGPAGTHFEAQVGAHYLLSMLLDAEPRGLPGVTIERVAFQRAGEGRALDDVIVHAHDPAGAPAVLEIQVKRSLSFTASDTEFRSVVAQIVRASGHADFWSQRYELAVAISRTSRKIDGAYQDVLSWARAIGDSATFAAQIERAGAGNDDMRTFVRTFKRNLREAGAPDDDEIAWKLLRRLQILVFDYTAPGSAWEQWDRERAARVLAPERTSSANALRSGLVELATQVASSAGDRTRTALIEDLRQRSFALAPLRRHRAVLARIDEHSLAALADINDRIGEIKLPRPMRLAEVRAALDEQRYVEIRGDAGVGKSGVLKHLAQQLRGEGRVLVLNPQRTSSGGWQGMRHILEFDGSARELLVELASSGGGVLFVDNVDFFDDGKQRTVIDLVRAAAEVPGVAVLVSARRSFATDEPSWLPADAIASLGGSAPILIDELSDSELAELRDAAPALAPLLAEGHPARRVTGNLFRLSRLAMRPALQQLRSEEEMAEWWWRSADGARDNDEGQRERARALRVVAEQAVRRIDPAIVENAPAAAIDALVQSETFRDLGDDRITFSHDVLREWAMACWLRFHPKALVTLPTDRPTPPDLARSIELLARLELANDATGVAWQQLLDLFSGSDIHGSWRRAVLLASVRSENATTLLQHASDALLSHEGAALVELIRSMQAIEVAPGAQVYADVLARLDAPPITFNIPRSTAWVYLILWMLRLGEHLPKKAIPDAVSLYSTWALGMLGKDQLTPQLMPSIYGWLTAIENGRQGTERDAPPAWPFDGSLERQDLDALEQSLRAMFVSFGNLTPDLAAAYLTLQTASGRDRILEDLMRFSGSLAQAAPRELAVLTEHYLLSAETSAQRSSRPSRNPFDFQDHTFMPASPTRGPFLELLTHARSVGLPLIRTLVDHAIEFKAGGRPPSRALEIAFPYGSQAFLWTQSYYWARGWSSAPYAISSALMALELWAHRRIEAGESLAAVSAEILGTEDAPACYLLPIVDLVLSHWPASRDFAIPLLASPELLSLDRERKVHECMGMPGNVDQSAVMLHLQQRPSRRRTLDDVIGKYATEGEDPARDALTWQLQRAKERLGPYTPQATLADPEFLVVHALNLINPANWRDVLVEREGRAPVEARQYQAPLEEEAHLAALRAQGEERSTDASMQAAIGLALEDPARSSPQFVEAAARWAMTPAVTPEDSDDRWLRDQATVAAAMILMRDGTAALRSQYCDWARQTFSRAIQADEDPVHRSRAGLRFNPKAMAFAGMLHALQERAEPEDVCAVLTACASEDPAAAYGLGAAINVVTAVEPRLLTAIMRCAFHARVEPARNWDISREEEAARRKHYRMQLHLAVEREISWLIQGAPEPDWPVFPVRPVRLRRRLTIRQSLPTGVVASEPPVQPDSRVDQQGAALWLTEALKANEVNNNWMLTVVRGYSLWTAQANGMDGQSAQDIENTPREWNTAYFSAVVRILPQLQPEDVHVLAITPVISLSDDSFFVAAEAVVRSLDWGYFGDKTIETNTAVLIRAAVANRLQRSHAWHRLSGDRSGYVETRSAPAIATIFFSDHDFIQSSKTYLQPAGIERIDPFLPTLRMLVESAPSLFVAQLVLGLMEVAPTARHLEFMLHATNCWLDAFPSSREFWGGSGVGGRICAWLERVREKEGAAMANEAPLRSSLDHLLAKLVALGISEASALEQALSNARGGLDPA